MEVSVTEAKARLSELLKTVEETGAEIVVSRHGRVVARIVPERPMLSPEERDIVMRRVQARVQAKIAANPDMQNQPSAARSQDFLYGDDGLPV